MQSKGTPPFGTFWVFQRKTARSLLYSVYELQTTYLSLCKYALTWRTIDYSGHWSRVNALVAVVKVRLLMCMEDVEVFVDVKKRTYLSK